MFKQRYGETEAATLGVFTAHLSLLHINFLLPYLKKKVKNFFFLQNWRVMAGVWGFPIFRIL